ncbi:zinc-dependent metalloprotease [Microbacterium karelineae]|uniref:zinc-dependent metalloprotease n=1 Tax=Microbacterium karelineae TaxID=2654283 RepID=UPI0012E9D3BF|nr:zinc-dependent metalloprotease [Microbacterium karelineae]
MLRRMLGGGEGSPFGESGIDPEQLKNMGIDMDPAMMRQMMRAFQTAMSSQGEGISWDSARVGALHVANQESRGVTAGQRTDLDQAFHLADLWLSEATSIAPTGEEPEVLTRGDWVEKTLPVWQEMAEPVAESIADALTEALRTQAPEEMQQMVQGASRMLRQVGGTLFATQLGQVVGRLSKEVVSGGDVGIPVMPAGVAAILPQNFADLGEGLEVPDDQLALYFAARELAHARLFKHAKWLRLHVMSQVTDYARGIHVDTEALDDLAARFDPSNPEELQSALQSGALLPQQTDAQRSALARLENMLALIEGWVDVVAADATARVPSLDRIAEATRRRRAVGGPAQDALGALVGLELRPRRLREAAAMWRAVGDAVGQHARDALWDYPDLVPTSDDIDDPSSLIARLEAAARGDEAPRDEMDDALAQLLAEESGGSSDDGPADDEPDGPRPV